MKTLAIETSCDDTSLGIVEFENRKFRPLKILLSSQIEQHEKFGGVVPELASRLHERKVIDLLEAFGKKEIENVDFITYTCCPGLPGSLLVGNTLANTLSKFLNKEKIPVYHIHGHIFSIFVERGIDDVYFPLLVLTVSGGHNELYAVLSLKDDLGNIKQNKKIIQEINCYLEKFMKNYGLDKKDLIHKVGKFVLYKLGFTLDDAAGEAFDKVSRMLGGPYPGGKRIYDISLKNTVKSQIKDTDKLYENICFSRAWLKKNEFNFSFSGLKAQVNYKIKELKQKYGEIPLDLQYKIAYEFQEAVVEVLGKKLLKAARLFGIENIAVVGGVSANGRLKEYIRENMSSFGVKRFYTPIKSLYSTDNAAMIGVVGLIKKLGI